MDKSIAALYIFMKNISPMETSEQTYAEVNQKEFKQFKWNQLQYVLNIS